MKVRRMSEVKVLKIDWSDFSKEYLSVCENKTCLVEEFRFKSLRVHFEENVSEGDPIIFSVHCPLCDYPSSHDAQRVEDLNGLMALPDYDPDIALTRSQEGLCESCGQDSDFMSLCEDEFGQLYLMCPECLVMNDETMSKAKHSDFRE